MQLRVACTLQLGEGAFYFRYMELRETGGEKIEPPRNMLAIRQRQVGTDLETPPDCTVQQIGMVCRSNQDNIAWQPVDLKQQGIQHSLDFSGLLPVFALLRKGIKLVEKQNTLTEARILKHFLNALRCLAQIAVNHFLVAHDEERNRERRSDCLRQRSLPVSRRSGQKHAASWLQIVGAQ